MSDDNKKCFVCKLSSREVPLIMVSYADQDHFICPGHLPILIHHPEQLTGILPGAENIIPRQD